MKQISELTSSLEARLEKRRDDFLQMLSGELNALRPTLQRIFQTALLTIESDMSSRSSEISQAAQRIFLRMGELEEYASRGASQAAKVSLGMQSLSEGITREINYAMETMRKELHRGLVERRKQTAALEREAVRQQSIKGQTGRAWVVAMTTTMLAAGLLVASWLALSMQLQARDEAFKELEAAQAARLETEKIRSQAYSQTQWLSGVFVGQEFQTAAGSWIQLNPTRLGVSGANTYLRTK